MKDFFEAISNCNPNFNNLTATVIKGSGFGEKAILSSGKIFWKSEVDGFLAAHEKEIAAFNRTGILELESSSVYVEQTGREKKIIICGAGHVSIPIIKIAKMTGFHVTVIDDRPIFAENGKQAGADIVICDEFEEALKKISGDLDTYFIIVTRGHQFDSECLREILKKPCAYIGMMGSRRRVRIVKDNMIHDGSDPEKVEAVHSPIGLDIKAETPEEIAVSIMAEVINVKNQRPSTTYPKEILRDILGTEHTVPLAGQKILFTIVEKHGSAPRNTGTKMIYTSEGKSIGTIGGGCTEAEVMRKAREMFLDNSSEPVLMHVNLTADEAAEEGEVCGGVIDVLLERV